MNAGTVAVVLGVGLAGVYLVNTGSLLPAGTAPRGIRNNNPGNIKYSIVNNWRGGIGVDNAGFVIFDTSQNGIRAIARILKNDILSDRPTIRLLIDEWAPPEDDNPTSAYALFVSERSGIHLDSTLTVDQLPPIVEAVIYFENGQNPYSYAMINEGVALA